MNALRAGAALLLLAALGACAPAAAPGPQAPPGAQLRLASSGVAVAGTGREIGFGRTEASTLDTLRDILGPYVPPRPAPACAGVETVRWEDEGLALHFDRSGFIGWEALPAAQPVSTLGGLRAGGPAPGDASLVPFERNGIQGLSGPDGEIARLWAGRDCPTPGTS